MTENDQQGQEQSTSQNTNTSSEGSQERTSQRSEQSTEEPKIPKTRFDEVNKRMKAAEEALRKVEEERERQEEERAQSRGEIEKVAEQRKKKLEKAEARIKELEADAIRKDRLTTWQTAAQGIIRPEAISDAFAFLSEEDFTGIDNTDNEAFTNLAQNLVEVRGYLAAEGPRGAGSGGSSRPVMVGTGASDNKHTNFIGKKQRNRRPWK